MIVLFSAVPMSYSHSDVILLLRLCREEQLLVRGTNGFGVLL